MAYLHCHNCGWEQDDFWSKDGYNPFRPDIIDWLRDCLFRDEIVVDVSMNNGEERMEPREFVAQELERKARSIRNMDVRADAE